MKTIIEEAIDAFQFKHDFTNCDGKNKAKNPCNHYELIERARNYESRIQRSLAIDLINKLKIIKDGWLDKPNIKEGSYAAFIELIFNVAIKFLEETK